MKSFAVFDTETTGFKPEQGARILEIAVVKINEDGNILDTWSTLLNPGDDVPLGATDIHKIEREMLHDAPTFAEIYGDLISILNNSVLVAHNAPFDISFLKNEVSLIGQSWPNPVVADTLTGARFLMPGLESYKLSNLAKVIGANFEGDAHAALADTKVTAQLFSHLMSLTNNVSWPEASTPIWPDIKPSGLFKSR